MKKINSESYSSSRPRVIVKRFGEVGDRSLAQIVNIIHECYERLTPHEVEVLDLYVFERSSSVEAFLAEESRKVGVTSSSPSELFFSMHDAWRGIPRIILCLERMRRLSTMAQKGGIHHEVGHSILHGNPRYYILAIPPVFQRLAKRFELSREYVHNMIYLISVAVKDYEVSRLLGSSGYVKDQIAFAKHILQPAEDDKTLWEISKARPDTEALCLTAYLKPIGYSTPFLAMKGSRINHYLQQSLSFLPKKHATKLLNETPPLFQHLELDTLSNINTFTRHIIKKIIEPILEKRWPHV